MDDDPVGRLRAICLALPEATEKEAWGHPTFRAGDKIFAHCASDHLGPGRIACWCKVPAGMQEALVGSDPGCYFVPPYVGPRGWIGAYLDVDPDWDDVEQLVAESVRLTAPKRLLALLDQG